MSLFTDEYVAYGFYQVVCIASDSREDSSGFQNETDTETAVARTRDGKFVSVESKRVRKFGPNGGTEISVNPREITESEYQTASERGHRVDISDALSKISMKEAKLEARKQLLATGPRCSIHNRKMALKDGKFGSFWGCRQPSCRKTEDLTSQQRALLARSK